MERGKHPFDEAAVDGIRRLKQKRKNTLDRFQSWDGLGAGIRDIQACECSLQLLVGQLDRILGQGGRIGWREGGGGRNELIRWGARVFLRRLQQLVLRQRLDSPGAAQSMQRRAFHLRLEELKS